MSFVPYITGSPDIGQVPVRKAWLHNILIRFNLPILFQSYLVFILLSNSSTPARRHTSPLPIWETDIFFMYGRFRTTCAFQDLGREWSCMSFWLVLTDLKVQCYEEASDFESYLSPVSFSVAFAARLKQGLLALKRYPTHMLSPKWSQSRKR